MRSTGCLEEILGSKYQRNTKYDPLTCVDCPTKSKNIMYLDAPVLSTLMQTKLCMRW